MRERALLFLISCVPGAAATITDFALGSQLAGGTITVTRFGGATASATFVADATGAVAVSPGGPGSGAFTLTVSAGDTSAATWTLTNDDTSLIFLNTITAVTIDLTLSGISLFDSGSAPSTPFSGAGVPGVVYLSGAAITGATDLLPWPDPANLGDMYAALTVTFSGIGTGASSAWMDDTDAIAPIPEPAAMAPVAAALAAFLIRWAFTRSVCPSPARRAGSCSRTGS